MRVNQLPLLLFSAGLSGWIALAGLAPCASGSTVGVTVADASSGDYTLTSVTVSRAGAGGGTFTYLPSELIGVDLTDVDAFQIPLLVQNGSSLPAAGTRATLLEDGRLDTGVINITTTNGTPDRALEVTFATPVVNSAGEDVLLFDLGGDDGLRFWIHNNRNEPDSEDLASTAFSANLISGMPYTLYGYSNGGDQDINSLEELESPVGYSLNSNSSGDIRAIGLDLSLVGVPLGDAVSSIRFQSQAPSGRIDPVMIVGLPAVPEPAGLASVAAAAVAGTLRRRRRRRRRQSPAPDWRDGDHALLTMTNHRNNNKTAHLLKDGQPARRALRHLLGAITACIALAVAATSLEAALIVPAYHSLPGAHAKLFIEFAGATYSGTWNGKTPGTTPAYDVDGNPASFSTTELNNIQQIFLRVAEKYSPFNIDVTTQNPGNENNKETARLVVGGDGAWYGQPAGGVALVGGFYTGSSNTAWVFPKNLSGGNPKTVAEATAHEGGHLFGLSHQSRWTMDADGKMVEQEYSTNGNDTARRPIMGSSYDSTRGLWWYGNTFSPTAYQDDLAILSNNNNGFGYRADDHGDSFADATELALDITGKIRGDGIISRMTDADLFAFSTGAGNISFSLATAPFGGMLDSTLRLFAGDGTLLQTADTRSLGESLTASVSAGRYLLGVYGRGNYGDLGQYTLSGQLVPVPEPAAVGLVFTAIALVQRRRRIAADPLAVGFA